MKHKNAFHLVLAATLLLSTTLTAQNMILKMQGTADQTIALNTLQKITFSNNNLVLNYTSGTTQSYGFSSLQKMYFTPLTAIKNNVQAKADIFFNPSDNQVHFRNLPEGNHLVTIFRTDGRAVVSKTISNYESIDMSGFPASIYLIRVNNQIQKFKK